MSRSTVSRGAAAGGRPVDVRGPLRRVAGAVRRVPHRAGAHQPRRERHQAHVPGFSHRDQRAPGKHGGGGSGGRLRPWGAARNGKTRSSRSSTWRGRRVVGGMGIGLTICRGIVTALTAAGSGARTGLPAGRRFASTSAVSRGSRRRSSRFRKPLGTRDAAAAARSHRHVDGAWIRCPLRGRTPRRRGLHARLERARRVASSNGQRALRSHRAGIPGDVARMGCRRRGRGASRACASAWRPPRGLR